MKKIHLLGAAIAALCPASLAAAGRGGVLDEPPLHRISVTDSTAAPFDAMEAIDATSGRDFSTYFPRARATRIDAADAPKIDGDLSDSVWSKAAPIEEFFQVIPEPGAAPSQKTKALVLFDEKNLYVGVYNYDDEPDKIVHRLLERDAQLRDEDAVRVMLDSLGTFRNGYFFGTNANGVLTDALIENNQAIRTEWNTIWDVRTRIVSDGWIAEYRIPFQSISFDPRLKDWNMQILRTIRRKNEEIRWSNIDRTRDRIDLSNPGRLEGIEGIKKGVGLETQLYVTGSASYDWETNNTEYKLRPSGNAFYKLTQSLTGSLTFNTDFSDAPLDQRQVNTGRFSLFFPETRDFFLQDVPVFEFGGAAFNERPNGLPFFSRRIGIVNGEPVRILAGAKISGQAGPVSIGAITALTGSSSTSDGQILTAARFSVPVFGESKAGLIFTHGDPAGGVSNTVAGADFQYKNSSAFPGTLRADIAYQRSFDGGVDDGMIAGQAEYRGQKWNWTAEARQIGADYNPRLGFLNRSGIRRYSGNAFRVYYPQNSWLRRAETGVFGGAVTDLDDVLEDSFVGGWALAENDAGDFGLAEYESAFEVVSSAFNLAGTVLVPAGRYHNDTKHLRVETSGGRPVSGEINLRWGALYGGEFSEVGFGLNLKPSMHFRLSGDYVVQTFNLPAGDIQIHVVTVSSTIPFSPRMTLKTDVQYDNISENFTWFSRFRWNPRAEQEVFLSFGHTALIDRLDFPTRFRSQGTSLALRLGQTWRF
ncbi:MAG: carbohydrate binding family 9 domain-containing protein [Parvularculaceae bacterium]|nr:carbohydrate binding family 9 domain-containing protein [Parvularculaceae bacterium]